MRRTLQSYLQDPRPALIFLAIWVAAALLFLTCTLLVVWVILPSFERLEREAAARSLDTAQDALLDRSQALGRTVADYAFWDDTYEFARSGSASYQAANLTAIGFANLQVAWFGIVDERGRFVAGGELTETPLALAPLRDELRTHLVPPSPLLAERGTDGVEGLLLTAGRLFMVASRPILHSDQSGPGRGFFVMATAIDARIVDALSRQVRFPVGIRFMSSPRPESEPRIVVRTESGMVVGESTLADLSGRTVARLTVRRPRDIVRQGRKTATFALVALLAVLAPGVALVQRLTRRLLTAQHARLHAEMRFRAAVEQATDGIALVDRATLRVVERNLSFERLLGLEEGAADLRGLDELVHADRADLAHWIEMTKLEGQVHLGDRHLRRPDGSPVEAEVSLSRVEAPEGPMLLVTLRDTSSQHRHIEQIERMAYFDALTGLPNRTQLQDRLRQSMSMATRQQWSLAFLFLDLDRFKVVNDSLGHDAGDELLVRVANRLAGCIREGDLLARLGGDEFAVLLGRAGENEVGVVAERIRRELAEPLVIRGRTLHVGASLGAALFPRDGQSFVELSRAADVAMYRAKRLGGGLVFYGREFDPFSPERLEFEADLRRAIAREELTLCCQPIVALSSGEISTMELLVRWPREGVTLTAAGFVPFAEEVGLAPAIDHLVLRQGLDLYARWLAEGASFRLAVNLSVHSLRNRNLASQLGMALEAAKVVPGRLVVEITETALLEGPDLVRATLEDLAALGVALSVDDFGSGYASIAYLRRAPLHQLKIDGALVRRVGLDIRDEKLVAGAIALGQSLDLEVVAEGVEKEEQVAWLQERGCDMVQGFLLGRPAFAAEIDGSGRAPVGGPGAQRTIEDASG